MIKAHSVSLPPKSILDPEFQYRHSWNTDLSETFRRARKERTQKERQHIHIQIDNRRASN